MQAYIEDLRGFMTVADLAPVLGLSWNTVKTIIKNRLEKDYGQPRLRELERLSIDEIYLGRRQWFWTLVIDLDTGRIVWVAPGRGGEALRKFWPALHSSRARIEAVAMDMSAAYWAAVAENLPRAAIVFDRFHITQLANKKLDDLRREMIREATGMMKQTVKGVRYLLLMRRDKIDEDHAVFFEVVTFTDQSIPTRFFLRGGQIHGDFITGEFFENLGDQIRRGRLPGRFVRSNHDPSMAKAEGFVHLIVPTCSSQTP